MRITEGLVTLEIEDPESTILYLKHARSRIEQGWCQGDYACDRWGEQIGATSSGATGFCVLGAVQATGEDFPLDQRGLVETILEVVAENHDPVSFNDHPDRTKEEVLGLFDQAIERLRT
jgi:hypothetical protein